jgi:hypothetical protein
VNESGYRATEGKASARQFVAPMVARVRLRFGLEAPMSVDFSRVTPFSSLRGAGSAWATALEVPTVSWSPAWARAPWPRAGVGLPLITTVTNVSEDNN